MGERCLSRNAAVFGLAYLKVLGYVPELHTFLIGIHETLKVQRVRHKPFTSHPRKPLIWHGRDSVFLTAHKQMFVGLVG